MTARPLLLFVPVLLLGAAGSASVGRVTDHLAEFVGGAEGAVRTGACLRGGCERIEDVKRTLAREGVPPNRIFHENFC